MSLFSKNIKSSLFFCFFLLFSCASSEQDSYDDSRKKRLLYSSPETNVSREIAYLKNISRIDESSFQFISKQMKNVIKKYNKIKRQLVSMEAKIDQMLKQQELLAKQAQKTKEFIEEDFEEEPDFEQAEEVNEGRNKEALSLNKQNLKAKNPDPAEALSLNKQNPKAENPVPEEDPLLWEEEITDDTILFHEEDKKDTRSAKNKRGKATAKNPVKKPSQLLKAEKLFQKKSYENAISEFQKYRDLYPKGAYYPEATFYIGESFKHLKMPAEAEIFFKEVVESHPQSLWVSRAKKNLQE